MDTKLYSGKINNPSISIGDVFVSTNGHRCEVIDYLNNKNITVKYQSGNCAVVQGSNLNRGAFRDKSLPKLFGVGVIGDEPCVTYSQSYKTWQNMLKRVYSPKPGGEEAAYRDCIIAPEWTYYSEFKKWFDSQKYEKGWHLDKDLLVPGNFRYSPETCIFLPQQLNKFLLNKGNCRGDWPVGVTFRKANSHWESKLSIEGKTVHLGVFDCPYKAFWAYKQAKEKEAKRLADVWKRQIDLKAYNALLRYEVDISA